MPAEYAHFCIADRALATVYAPKLKAMIQKHKNVFYLGCLGPDTPYYYLSGVYKSEMSQLADVLHGRSGENTLNVFDRLVSYYKDEIPDYAWAYVLGYSMHVITDGIFHPMVYYFTGDPNHSDPAISENAQYRHRVLESALNYYYRDKIKLKNKGLVKNSVASMSISKDQLLRLMRFLFFGHEKLPLEAVEDSLKKHCRFQSYFNNPFMKLIVSIISIFARKSLGIVKGNFYMPSFRKHVSKIDGIFDYQHPVTGERFSRRIEDLERQVSKRTQQLFGQIEIHLGKDDFMDIIRNIKGWDLETGLPLDEKRPMQFFNVMRV